MRRLDESHRLEQTCLSLATILNRYPPEQKQPMMQQTHAVPGSHSEHQRGFWAAFSKAPQPFAGLAFPLVLRTSLDGSHHCTFDIQQPTVLHPPHTSAQG